MELDSTDTDLARLVQHSCHPPKSLVSFGPDRAYKQ